MKRTHPKVLAKSILCSKLGYILNLYALFNTFLLAFQYFLITSIVTPPVVSKLNDLVQKYSFQSLVLICGNSFLINLLLALLYALINFVNSVFWCPLKRTCTWSI